MNSFLVWAVAIRPKTLGISVSPVIVGATLAWAQYSVVDLGTLSCTLCTALLIQIGTNLYNDAVDFERGTDTPDRVGPERVTAQGWLSATAVKKAAFFSFGLALLGGLYLVSVGGWPILLIGILSLTAGYGYTGGPKPIAYSKFGELFVFLFFGIVAVMGSYYLQCGELTPESLYTGAALGSLASAVMLVNNYRDLDTDRRANKLTLVNYLGRQLSCLLFTILTLLPFLLPLVLTQFGWGVWLVVLVLPPACVLVYRFFRLTPGPLFNPVLVGAAQLQLIYAVLLSAGLLLRV